MRRLRVELLLLLVSVLIFSGILSPAVAGARLDIFPLLLLECCIMLLFGNLEMTLLRAVSHDLGMYLPCNVCHFRQHRTGIN